MQLKIDVGSRVLLPFHMTFGTVQAIDRYEDGKPRRFRVTPDGASKSVLVALDDAYLVKGVMFFSPGGDDCRPTTPLFAARGGVC